MYVKHKDVIDRDESKYRSPLKKFLLFAVIVCLPLVIVMAFFSPFAKKDASHLRLKPYVLAFPVERPAVDAFIGSMRIDPEFSFYFQIIDEQGIARVADEAYGMLTESNSEEKLFENLKGAHGQAEAAAALFYNLEYHEAFFTDRESYPEYDGIMKQFIAKEFKAAVLGLVYKANYQPEFIFQWDNVSILAAKKFRDIVFEFQKK